jgi:hypothetical protein
MGISTLGTNLRTFPFDPLSRTSKPERSDGRLTSGPEVAGEDTQPQVAEGFVVDADVPLPGSYTFRRIVKLDVRSLSGKVLRLKRESGFDLRGIAVSTSNTIELKYTNASACDFWARRAIAAGFPAAAVARSVELVKQGATAASARPDIDGVLRSFILALKDGEIELPILTSSGVASRQLYYSGGAVVSATAGFYAIEEYRISAFLTRYGLGRTIGTFSLLPGEETTIKMRSWRSMQRTAQRSDTADVTATSSIVDSVDEKSIDRFANELQAAIGDKTSSSSEERWHVNGEVGGTIGFAHAKVEAGGGGDYRSGQEDFANQATKAVKEHTDEASRNRKNTVENVSRSSSTESQSQQSTEEQENVVERQLKNINLRRVLNYVFRELNQEYDVLVHLTNVRFAYSTGAPGSWREVPMSKLRALIEEVCDVNVDAGGVGTVDPTKPFSSEVAAAALEPVSRVLDISGTYRDTLDCVVQSGAKTEVADLRRSNGEMWLPADETILQEDLGAIPAGEVVKVYPRFKLGALSALSDDKELPRVDGVVVGRTVSVLRTDNVVVEALLGYSDALDPFAFRSQDLTTDASAAANALQSLEAERLKLALETLRAISDPKERADAFAKFFPPPAAPRANAL